MNGNRLNEHRKRRVPITNWMILIGVIAGVLALGATLSKGAGPEMLKFNGNTGSVGYGVEVCMATTITPDRIGLLGEWRSLVDRYEATELDGILRMTREEAERAEWLDSTQICGSIARHYNVIIKEEINQYVLFQFDPQYGFGEQTYIMRRSDFMSDRGL